MDKDTSQIPEGMYCYAPDNERVLTEEEKQRGVYPIKLCPYYSSVEDEGVKLPFCSFLKKGGTENEMSDEDFERLKNKYGSSEKVWEQYPLGLLWDQVKECGENKDW